MHNKKTEKFALWPPEHHKIYEEAVRKLRQKISSGHTYGQAFDTLEDLDQAMRAFLEEDFLKILIAEEHFGANIAIDDMALFLDLPIARLESCRNTLLEEMHVESAEHFRTNKKKSH